MNRIICLLALVLAPAAFAQLSLPPAGQYDRDDIRAYGADCTGHAGSTSAIQNALAASKVVRIPSPCYLKADAEIRIEGARAGDGWRLYGTGVPDFTGDMPGGAVIFGCGAWTGPVFDINRTGHWEIYGIKVEATPDTQVKPLCPSGSLASGSFLVENDTSRGGFTQTNFKFDHVAFDYGGQPRPAGAAQPYIALQVGTGHGSNNENMESGNIVNSSFQGREQPGSIAIQVLACCAQSYTISNLKPFMGFYRGFTGNFGGMVEHVNAGDEGGYRQFGPGGALFALTGCADGLTVNDVSTSELSGPYWIAPGAPGLGCVAHITGSHIAVDNGQLAPEQPIIATGGFDISLENDRLVDDFYDLHGRPAIDTTNAGDRSRAGTLYLREVYFWSNSDPYYSGPGVPSPIAGSYTPVVAPRYAPGPLTVAYHPGPGNDRIAPSPAICGRASAWTGSARVFDSACWASVGAGDGARTIAFNYTPLAGQSARAMYAFDHEFSGVAAKRVSGAPRIVQITQSGAPGSASYSYSIVGRAGNGTTAASAPLGTRSGAAALAGSDCNVIDFGEPAGADGGLWGYDIYRISGGKTQGRIATVGAIEASAAAYNAGTNAQNRYYDCGSAADGTTPPARNTTGRLETNSAVVLGAASPPEEINGKAALWFDGPSGRVKMMSGNASAALSAAIAAGQSTTGTAPIAAHSCSAALAASAPGVAPDDVIAWSFRGPPPPGFGGGLTIMTYAAADQVNFVVCNPTASAIAPAPANLNWRVTR